MSDDSSYSAAVSDTKIEEVIETETHSGYSTAELLRLVRSLTAELDKKDRLTTAAKCLKSANPSAATSGKAEKPLPQPRTSR